MLSLKQQQQQLLVSFARAISLGLLIGLGACSQPTPDELLENARQAMSIRQHRTAEIHLKNLLQQAPHAAEARLLLGEVSLLLGDLAAARQEARRAADDGANPHEAAALLARVLMESGDFPQALQVLSEVGSESPEHGLTIRVLEGDAHLGLNDLSAAEASFRAGLEIDPESASALLGLAKAAAVRVDDQAMYQYLEQSLGADASYAPAWLFRGYDQLRNQQFESAVESFGEVLVTLRNSATRRERFSARTGRVEANLALNAMLEAERDIQQLREDFPRHPFTLYFSGRLAALNGDYDTAVEELQQALSDFPAYIPAQFLIAAVKLSQGQLEQAEQFAKSVALQLPENRAAQVLLAEIRVRQGRLEEAIGSPFAATTENREERELLMLAARSSFVAGDIEPAMQLLRYTMNADPKDPSIVLMAAGELISSGENERAAEMLARLPADADLGERRVLRTILELLAQQRYQDAIDEVEVLQAARPDDAMLYSLLSSVKALAGDLTGAKVDLARSLEIRPQQIRPRLRLAVLAIQQNNWVEAERELSRVLELDEANQTAQLLMSQVLFAQGRSDEAVKILEDANSRGELPGTALASGYLNVGRQDEALALAETLTQASPDNLDAWIVLARTQMALRMIDKAQASYERALQLDPDSQQLRLALANTQLASGEPGAAVGNLETVKADPKLSALAGAQLVETHLRVGNVAAAEEELRQLRELDTAEEPLVNYLAGLVALRKGDANAAVSALQSSWDQRPVGQTAIILLRARHQAKLPQPERVLLIWLNANPSDTRARFELAQYFQSTGNDHAATEYERLLEIEPANPIVLNNLAWLYHERGDVRALDTAERAYAASPAAPIADTLGWLLVNRDGGATDRAVKLLRQAAEQMSDQAEVQFHLAYALNKAGATQSAREQLAKLLATSQPFVGRDEAEALFAALSDQ